MHCAHESCGASAAHAAMHVFLCTPVSTVSGASALRGLTSAAGGCKVISLRERQYMLLAEEVLSSPHQTFVHACVQPSASISDISSMSTSRSSSLAPSRQLPAEDLPGSLTTGGYTFFLATLVKVCGHGVSVEWHASSHVMCTAYGARLNYPDLRYIHRQST